jgi:hypothetical protein
MPGRRGVGLPIGILLALAGGCVHATQPTAAVHFALDAPLCSSVIPVQLSIDGALVATDTFRVHLDAPHTISRAFAMPAGVHMLGARAVVGHVWPDTSVTLAPGESFTWSLPFYCS